MRMNLLALVLVNPLVNPLPAGQWGCGGRRSILGRSRLATLRCWDHRWSSEQQHPCHLGAHQSLRPQPGLRARRPPGPPAPPDRGAGFTKYHCLLLEEPWELRVGQEAAVVVQGGEDGTELARLS